MDLLKQMNANRDKKGLDIKVIVKEPLTLKQQRNFIIANKSPKREILKYFQAVIDKVCEDSSSDED